MGIYIVLNVLPEWMTLVLHFFPGFADLYGSIWFGSTDPDVDHILK